MAYGYRGTVLHIHLDTGSVRREHPSEVHYRRYMGGSALGTWYVARHTGPETDPLAPENVLVVAPGVTTGTRVSGVSRCAVCALSPITGAVGDGQTGGKIGPWLKRAGYDAVVFRGRSPEPVFLVVDGEDVYLESARSLWGRTTSQVLDELSGRYGKGWTVLQCGPAGERRVRWACLLNDGNDAVGRTGMGAVFGSKNLRALVVRGHGPLPVADEDAVRAIARRAASRIEPGTFQEILRRLGTPGILGIQAEAGNLATRNYSRSHHPRYRELDGSSFHEDLAAGTTSCFGCAVACRKKVRVSPRAESASPLGGPEFETLGLLGSNMDITDPVAVARANERCGELGLDTITTGAMASWIAECQERGVLSEDQIGRSVRFGDPEGLLWLVERIGAREGIGDVLARGFHAAVEALGERTRPWAIQVKNQGLPVHMAQVKPSQALMYAVCPIGPDHQSCEHDWLVASGGDEARALGLLDEADPASSGVDKVRMVVYGQLFYSLLDSLCLCMFCFGPGNLYTYRDLVDLLAATTGWECSLWELMKVGERRVNLMRQVNARRGFTRADDRLPPRLFEPLPDGPATGRHVDPESFAEMQDLYYAFMGWDPDTGNPTRSKLLELGLSWTLERPT